MHAKTSEAPLGGPAGSPETPPATADGGGTGQPPGRPPGTTSSKNESAFVQSSLGGGGNNDGLSQSKSSTAQKKLEERQLAQRSRDRQLQAEAQQQLSRSLDTLREERRKTLRKAALAQVRIERSAQEQESSIVATLQVEMRKHASAAERLGMSSRPRSLRIRGHRQSTLWDSHDKASLWESHDKASSITKLHKITASTNAAQDILTALKLKEGLEEIRNQYCRESEAMTMELENSQATEDDEGIRGDVLYARLDLERAEEPEEDAEPLFMSQDIDLYATADRSTVMWVWPRPAPTRCLVNHG